MVRRFLSTTRTLVSFLLLSVTVSACNSILSSSEGATMNGEDTGHEKASLKEQDQFMVRQAEAMQKQQQELEDLKRQRYQDGYLRDRYDVDGDGTID